MTGRSTVSIDGREWARWSDAQQKGYIELNSMSEQGVAEDTDQTPYQIGYQAWTDYLSSAHGKVHPSCPYKAGNGMDQWEKGAEQAYNDHHDKTQDVAEDTEQVFKVLAVSKSNALGKKVKLNVKASSLDEVFERLAASDWYPLDINGVEVINGKRLKQGMAEAEKNPHTSALGKALYRDLSKRRRQVLNK